LGLGNDRQVLHHDNQLIKVDVSPISIHYWHFNKAFDDDNVVALRESLLRKLIGSF
jgi:trehalose-6-phosphate synthase